MKSRLKSTSCIVHIMILCVRCCAATVFACTRHVYRSLHTVTLPLGIVLCRASLCRPFPFAVVDIWTRFAKVTHISLTSALLLMGIVGVSGYLPFGQATCANVLDNFDESDDFINVVSGALQHDCVPGYLFAAHPHTLAHASFHMRARARDV